MEKCSELVGRYVSHDSPQTKTYQCVSLRENEALIQKIQDESRLAMCLLEVAQGRGHHTRYSYKTRPALLCLMAQPWLTPLPQC